MVQICVMGGEQRIQRGHAVKTGGGDVQDRFSHEILLATVDGKLQELHKKVKEGTAVEFLTAADKPGIQTYRRVCF